jgi:microcystin-dependent protein
MSWTRDFFTLSAHQKPNVGDIKTSVVNTDHLGWLLCDGRLVQKSEYGLLFYQIGYTFGGSEDEFRLPDGRGRVVGNTGSSGGGNWAYGQTTGEEMHLMTLSELVSHNHTVQNSLTGISVNSSGSHTHTQTTVNDDFNNSASAPPPGGYPDFSQPSYPKYDSAGSVTWTNTINESGTHTHTITDDGHTHTVNNKGGSTPFNVMQPTIFMGNMFIYSGKTNAGAWPYTPGTNVA